MSMELLVCNADIYPLVDNIKFLKDNESAYKIMKQLNFVKGEGIGALPEIYNKHFNMETDESFSRIFF